jgi:hypothetical protein
MTVISERTSENEHFLFLTKVRDRGKGAMNANAATVNIGKFTQISQLRQLTDSQWDKGT